MFSTYSNKSNFTSLLYFSINNFCQIYMTVHGTMHSKIGYEVIQWVYLWWNINWNLLLDLVALLYNIGTTTSKECKKCLSWGLLDAYLFFITFHRLSKIEWAMHTNMMDIGYCRHGYIFRQFHFHQRFIIRLFCLRMV